MHVETEFTSRMQPQTLDSLLLASQSSESFDEFDIDESKHLEQQSTQ